MILLGCVLWCALRTRRILRILLWTTGLLDEKVAIAVSGWSWSGETVACDVHRSLCGDIIDGPSNCRYIRAVLGGSPLSSSIDGCQTESDRRGKRGGSSHLSLSTVVLTPSGGCLPVFVCGSTLGQATTLLPLSIACPDAGSPSGLYVTLWYSTSVWLQSTTFHKVTRWFGTRQLARLHDDL